MIWWTGLAPWEFEFPFPGSLTYTFLGSVLSLGSVLALQEELRRATQGLRPSSSSQFKNNYFAEM